MAQPDWRAYEWTKSDAQSGCSGGNGQDGRETAKWISQAGLPQIPDAGA
ncbi:hypothetical protein [Williamsia muralis]